MTKRSLLRETIIKLLEEDSKFYEGDSIITKENDKGKITLAKHPFYAVVLDNTGTTHSYHVSDLQIDPEAEQDMDFGKYDTTEPEQQEEPLDKIQESVPSDIIHMDGLLTVNEELNVTDVLSDIRSITGITVVRSIDIPGESHKNKLKIKIDPYPFRGIAEDIIKQKIKTTIRKIPGVKEFWSGVIKDNLQEKKFRIKEDKWPIVKKHAIEQRLIKECVGLSEAAIRDNYDAEIFQELANPDTSYNYEESTPNHYSFTDKFDNKLEVKYDPTTKDIESYYLLKDKTGNWIEVYDYDRAKILLDPNSQIYGNSDDRRSDTICKIIRDEIIPKNLLDNKPKLIRLHPLNQYRYKIFLKCAKVCKEKYPEIEIKEIGPYIMLINK